MNEREVLSEIINWQIKATKTKTLREISQVLAQGICDEPMDAIEDTIEEEEEEEDPEPSLGEPDLPSLPESAEDLKKRLAAVTEIPQIKVDDLTFDSLMGVAKHYRIEYSKLYYRVEKQNMNVQAAVRLLKNISNSERNKLGIGGGF